MADSLREEAVFPRPSSEEIRSKWNELFSDPLISPSRLKATALTKAGLGEAAADGGVVLRSVYWRFYHGLLPPPTSPNLFAESVTSSRQAYNTLRRRYLIAPDGRWASDCTGSEDHSSSSSSSSSVFQPNTAGSSTSKSDGWDPLSLDTSSPWKTWFAHVDLRSTISQDVDRTFPDIPYFQLSHVKKSLITSLFLFSVLNPDVGYRQGMHELLACCFLAVDRDSLNTNTRSSGEREDEAMWVTLDRRYVEHDAFQLFQAVMRGAKEFYEWRAEEGPIKNRSANAPQAPIITRCNNIHNSLIRRIDPQLWERLETEGVEAQIWAIRWLRLIFTREIPFPIAMRIWDGVFAEDPGLGILDLICVAMLLLIRNELIEADYPTLLTQLLHYPSPSPTYPFEPSLILSQALFLKNNISPAAGVEVVLQNQDILGVKVNRTSQVPAERPPVRGGFVNGGTGRGGSRGRAGMGGLAQGLFERAQAAGLDKAFMTTVADLRKNLPDSATAYSYLPNLPFSPGTPSRETGSFSTIPTSTSALPNRSFPSHQTRPSIDTNPSADSVQSLKDAELEMAELRLAMVGMGKAMSEWLAILRPSPETDTDSQGETGEKEIAWRGLERIKDGLLDAAGKETEEIVREWGWHEGLESSSISSRSTTPAPAPAPAESSNHDSQSQTKEVHVEKGQLDFEDTTPTLNQTATMPAQLSFPSPTQPKTQVFNPAPMPNRTSFNTNNTNKPVLTLSSRSTPTPSSGLPRTPISVPPGPGSGSGPTTAPLPVRPHSTTLTGARPQSATITNVRPQTADLPKEQERGGDPLAGLGVTSRDMGEGWKKDKDRRSNGNGNGVDPLLGVGIR